MKKMKGIESYGKGTAPAVLLSCLLYVLLSCGSDALEEATPTPSKPEEPKAIAVTGDVYAKTKDHVDLMGRVNLSLLEETEEVVEFGVEVSANDDFADAIRRQSMDRSDRGFLVRVYNLKPHTTYFYHTYVMASEKCYYGERRWFTTNPDYVKPDDDGDDMNDCVDLGLSDGTLWATMNVGANKPEEAGFRFAWRETEPKKEFTEENYLWKDDQKYSLYDHLMELVPEEDAARAKWGENWCMPTQEQCEVLLKECYWTISSLNGVKGFWVYGRIPGSAIFFPITKTYYDYSYTQVWTKSTISVDMNTLKTYTPMYMLMRINLDVITGREEMRLGLGWQDRYAGMYVRPVRTQRITKRN